MESVARLPLPLSSFIGRQTEIESVHQLLCSGVRLVTLTGPGGVGKTRLALEFTAQNANAFVDGVFFVSLQALTEPEQVLEEVASVLRVRESGTRSLLEDLCDALADKHALLCIDNWEHVLDAAPQLADLLAACRWLHVIATSREALRLQGEHEYPVHALSVPVRDEQHPLDAAQAEAVKLFSARASAVKLGFEVNESNALVIGEICTLLDGLPLAIELVAALLRLFSPQALLARLQNSSGFVGRSPVMQLLVGGSRDLPVRQQTLRAAIAWSYNLLDTKEQRLFRLLAIFAGGCELEAVEAVCGDLDTASRPILDLLIALVDQNLLRAREVDGEPRFAMLRTIQEYAAEQLVGSGELHDVQQRHAQHYLDLVERGDAAGHGPHQAPWQARMERNHDNLRALLTWSLAQPERASIAYRLGEALWRFWSHRGHWAEARQWLTRILALEGSVPSVLKAKVLRNAGIFATQQGDFDLAEQYFVRSLSVARSVEDKIATRNALNALGTNAYLKHDPATAIAHFQASLVLDRELGDQWGIAKRLNGIGNVLLKQRDFDSALAHVQQSLAKMRELGDAMEIAECLLTLGEIALGKDDDGEAHPYLTECRTLFNDLQDPWGVAAANHGLGLIALRRGKLAQAQTLFADSLQGRKALGDKLGIAESLEAMACLAAAHSSLERAARLWGAATALRSAISASLMDSERFGFDPYVKAVRTRLRERQFDAAANAGAAMSLDQALRFAAEPPDAAEQSAGRKPPRRAYPAGLSVREVEVLALVAQGLTDGEVAERLVLSIRTVNAHLTSIYNKLGVNSRVAATRFAIDEKLV
ncbi:tetratricopeptide repeat protein [Caldilinea sp.]|uniref:tetratricopeptide repeat protein n=1 Tax=Caldilinea sp. TaxID=2293560 RepID=UPI002C8CB5BB|nr:tetratricopeptide repeat protein [Caldilinea sp.]